jgi:uncharacterized protein
MRRLALGAAAFLAAAAAAFGSVAADTVPVPKLTAHVVDLTGTLTVRERDALEEKLRSFEAAKGSQVAVLLVPTIGSETIEEFAGRVTDEWKLGRKSVDDGVLFVVAKQERKMRIHTGRGVQGTLTDALSRRIIADIVAPRFRSGDFAGGIGDGVDAIMKAIEGEALPLPAPKAQGKVDTLSAFPNLVTAFIVGLVLISIFGGVLRAILGRFLGAAAASGIAGAVAWFIVGSLALGIVLAIVAFLVTLFMSGTGGRGGGFVPGGWGGGGGSWGGGGGGFSGGGGGFSGGGGSFDGGGSSGSW